jgi:hypothetical protein
VGLGSAVGWGQTAALPQQQPENLWAEEVNGLRLETVSRQQPSVGIAGGIGVEGQLRSLARNCTCSSGSGILRGECLCIQWVFLGPGRQELGDGSGTSSSLHRHTLPPEWHSVDSLQPWAPHAGEFSRGFQSVGVVLAWMRFWILITQVRWHALPNKVLAHHWSG